MVKKLILGLILLSFLGGCIGVGSEKIEKASMGQELVDLKKARDAGAINEEEYLELKRKIMNRE